MTMTAYTPPASGDQAARDGLLAPATALRSSALDLLEDAVSATSLPSTLRSVLVERLQRVGNDLRAVIGELDAPAEQPTETDFPMPDSPQPAPSQDAAIVLALAATALPFAASEAERAECWLRMLRRHGAVGRALESAGVAEAPIDVLAEPADARDPAGGEDMVRRVNATAMDFALRHGSRTIDTVHLLMAVFSLMGPTFDRGLYAAGTSREELLQLLTEDSAVRN
jgi:hypothetical protein